MSYSFHPAAEAEFLESAGYYESSVPGLGSTFIEEVELQPDIRRAPLDKFPLSIIYREKLTGFQILAIAHDRRRPQYWLERRNQRHA